jgi:hypothetical protein
MIPDLPVRAEPVEYECLSAIPLVAGALPPEDLVEPGTFTVSCSAVAVPTSQVAYLLATHQWALGAELVLKAQADADASAESSQWLQAGAVGILLGFCVGVFVVTD